jgi:signal transduction histidine kinase
MGVSRSGVHIELNPEVASVLKAERNRRLHTVQIPLLRLIGLPIFALGAGVHNWLILGDVSWPVVLRFLFVVVAYSLVSWALLWQFFDRTGRLNLGDLLLAVDVLFLVTTIYLSGGEQSWLFFVLLGRVADQTSGGFRRTVRFAHLCTFTYVLMLLWITTVDGRDLPMAATAAKVGFVYLGGWYMALCALPVERRRESTIAAIRRARELIARLRVTTDALEEARLHAESANEAKSRFLTTMTHEVRTPIGAVIGMAELLEGTELDPQQQEFLEHLQDGADMTLRLLSDAIDFAALEKGVVDLEEVPFSPSAVVHSVVREYATAASAKGVELRATTDGCPEQVIGDRRRCRQLLRLLVDNAVKFTDEGVITVSCASGEPRAEGATLRWTVTDTGIGFDPDDLPYLLQPFEQARSGSTRAFDGAGLGLALAQRLAQAMGGAIEATSAPGQGSTFEVEVRVNPAAKRPGRKGGAAAVARGRSWARPEED